MELEWENVESLIDRFENNGDLEKLEISYEGFALRLKKRTQNPPAETGSAGNPEHTGKAQDGQSEPQKLPADQEDSVPEGTVLVKAPLVGTFFSAPEPGAEDYAQEGKVVKKGDTIGLIEAMKIMNEIPAPCDGIVSRIFVKNNDFVAYDAPLFLIRELGNV